MTNLKKFTLGFTGFVLAVAFSTASLAEGDDEWAIKGDTFEGLSADLNSDVSYGIKDSETALAIPVDLELVLLNDVSGSDVETDTIKTR